MKTLLTMICTVALTVLLLRSGHLPWLLIDRDEVRTERERAEERAGGLATPTPPPRDPFFERPDYRTALDKEETPGDAGEPAAPGGLSPGR